MPTDSSYIESFNGKFRAECLNAADFAHERLIGANADMSHNPGKFQLPLAQIRGAPQKTAGANSKLDKTWGQGHWLADVLARIAELPVSRLHELLPWEWKAIKAMEIPAAA